MRLDYRAAIVTGASSGIGAELARQLAASGVAVGLTARRAELLDVLAAEIRAAGGVAHVATADAADREATLAALADLESRLGPVDLLVANAGVGVESPVTDRFPGAAIDAMVRVNLLGPVAAIEAFLPGMLARGRGHLVGISSLAAYRGLPGSVGYSASKAGLSTLLEGLRIELRGRGIAVTTVHPGFIRTPMTAKADHPMPFVMDADAAARAILRGVAARRREVNFPAPMAALMAFVRRWPNALYDRAAAGLVRPGPGREPGPPA